MEALTLIVVVVAVVSAAAVNAEVQRRLLAQGGSWFPSTVKSGLCGFAALICIVTVYFIVASAVVRISG